MKKRVFSGIQPSGELHIGNYFGAIRPWVESQQTRDNIFCIVDLHAITIPQDAEELKNSIRNLAISFFAAGIDPKHSSVFVQSQIPAHAELAWILNCFIPMGWMQRMTQFKEKSGAKKDKVSVGLFAYPALMAADILLYQTDLVPVGDDQKQHVELARDVAQSFNSKYGETFKIPEPLIPKTGARIMALDDPTKKMAKSEAPPNRIIYLLDSPDVIRKKIARATTDSLKEIRFDSKRPGIYNLLTIYELISKKKRQDIESQFQGKQYSDFKRELADSLIEELRPIRERAEKLKEDPKQIDALLKTGASKIAPVAEKTLKSVKQRIGLG